jgi:hypothetical protein
MDKEICQHAPCRQIATKYVVISLQNESFEQKIPGRRNLFYCVEAKINFKYNQTKVDNPFIGKIESTGVICSSYGN